MTGSAAATPDADRDWVGKVLAGDAVACGVLALARDLPDAEWDILARHAEQVRAGVPVTDVLASLWQERGEEHPRSG